MINKTTLPEPVAKVIQRSEWGGAPAFIGNGKPHPPTGALLITTNQAEAYANARVKQVLDEAAMILKANAEVCHSDTGIILRANAEAIRALIPKEPPCDTC